MAQYSSPIIKDAVQNVVSADDPQLDVASLAITPSSLAITGTATLQMVLTATMQDGSSLDVTSKASYVSATPAKGTVSATGLLTGVAAGTSVITATYAGISTSKTLTVS